MQYFLLPHVEDQLAEGVQKLSRRPNPLKVALEQQKGSLCLSFTCMRASRRWYSDSEFSSNSRTMGGYCSIEGGLQLVEKVSDFSVKLLSDLLFQLRSKFLWTLLEQVKGD